MKNLNTILLFGITLFFISCRPSPEETIETCSSGVQGSFSFNASNGESYDMTINDETTFWINQVTHPTEGSALYLTNAWYPNSNEIYGVNGIFIGGAQLGTTSYEDPDEEGGLSLTFTELDNGVQFSYNSTSITLNISEANLCLGGVFCPIEATFSGTFIKTSFPSEVTETVTVNGSFCLYKTI